jgi:succinyl-diaminopimelate desuccinylase
MTTRTLALAEELIARRSVTPEDGGCQAILIARLTALGFACESLGHNGVTNLFARRLGAHGPRPVLSFAGHTDVVPTGPLEQWQSDPFTPTRREGKLFGRGAADMKSSIAAFVVAAEEFIGARPEHRGAIALLITSDEEGPATDGTVRLCELLHARNETLDYCIVGEPTSVARTGDMIKNGRRGSLSGRLSVDGVQGHVAYPHLASNPIHRLAPALTELIATRWDDGNEHYLPTAFQVSNLHAGTGAKNVIPGEAVVDFNFRFSTASTADSLRSRVHAVLDRHALSYRLEWVLGGRPFLTPPGVLSDALTRAIRAETGLETELSTTGGTSDGRFIIDICPEVIECGPPNATIHKINEHIELDALESLKNIYRRTLELLL